MNAFVLVVTVALGSMLASVSVSRTVPLANGLAALAMLVAMQFLVAWASTRWAPFERLAKSKPRVLFYRGAFAREAMRIERVAEGRSSRQGARRASARWTRWKR